MYFNFFYVIIASIIAVVASYLFGAKGLEAFYATVISLCILSTWIVIQLIKKLYSLPDALILKILVTPLPIIVLLGGWLVSLATLSIEGESINWWIVLIGVIPFLIPRIGMYKKITRANKLSIGLLITTFSILILYMAFTGFQTNTHSYHKILLVIAVQAQLLLTYLTVQTNYLERFRTIVLNVCERLGIRKYKTQALIVICVVGLPYIVCIYLIMYLAL